VIAGAADVGAASKRQILDMIAVEADGKPVSKEVRDARLRAAVEARMLLPGRRLFQYHAAQGAVHTGAMPIRV